MDILTAAFRYLDSLLSWSTAKAAAAAIIASGCSLLSMAVWFAHPSIPFLLALVCMDFALGVYIALREYKYSWTGFRHGLGKFVAYSLAFIVTSFADQGIGIASWDVNITVLLSTYAISGEGASCLVKIDHIYPGRIPAWLITRLLTLRKSMENDTYGFSRRKGDWSIHRQRDDRRMGDALPEEIPASCRGRIPDDEEE